MMNAIRLLGIDPGLGTTGWGVIESAGSRLHFIASGRIQTMPRDPLSVRLLTIAEGIEAIINDWKPMEAAIEEVFVNTNPASTLKLAHARGVALMTPARSGLCISEYAPNKIKKTLVGRGHADKRQIQMMVKTLLLSTADTVASNAMDSAMDADAADALAVAICHAHHRHTAQRVASSLVAQTGTHS